MSLTNNFPKITYIYTGTCIRHDLILINTTVKDQHVYTLNYILHKLPKGINPRSRCHYYNDIGIDILEATKSPKSRSIHSRPTIIRFYHKMTPLILQSLAWTQSTGIPHYTVLLMRVCCKPQVLGYWTTKSPVADRITTTLAISCKKLNYMS